MVWGRVVELPILSTSPSSTKNIENYRAMLHTQTETIAWKQLLPTLHALSRQDKLRIMQFLLSDLADE